MKAIMNADTWVTVLSSSLNSKGTVNKDLNLEDRVMVVLLGHFWGLPQKAEKFRWHATRSGTWPVFVLVKQE